MREINRAVSAIEDQLAAAEIDYAWALHEGARPLELAQLSGKVAALRFVCEQLLDEAAVEAFALELVKLAGALTDQDRTSPPAVLLAGELFLPYRITGMHPHLLN